MCRESKGQEAFSGRQWSAQARVRKCRACSEQAVPPCVAQAAGAPEAGAPEAGTPPLLRGHVADSHVPGMLVRVKGLLKTHEHNGKLATILPAKAPVGRVVIAMKGRKGAEREAGKYRCRLPQLSVSGCFCRLRQMQDRGLLFSRLPSKHMAQAHERVR